MPRDMSWLSPKRRRTTTALPTVHSGRKNGVVEELSLSPSPRFTSPKPVLPSPALKQRSSRTFSSASTTSATPAPEGEGSLFYAYARRVCKSRSCNVWHANLTSYLAGRRSPLSIPAYFRLCASRKRMVVSRTSMLPRYHATRSATLLLQSRRLPRTSVEA
jgi:hypothetical protein